MVLKDGRKMVEKDWFINSGERFKELKLSQAFKVLTKLDYSDSLFPYDKIPMLMGHLNCHV